MGALFAYNRANAIGFDHDDFIVARFLSNDIAVYDYDFTFKGLLDSNITRPTGLDFDLNGNLVVAKQYQGLEGDHSEVRVYNTAGVQISSIASIDLGDPMDVKVGSNGLYYVGTQDFGGGNGMREFSSDGTMIRQFDTGDYEGVALLPGGVAWGGSGSDGSFLKAFDIDTGVPISSILLDHGQKSAASMFVSRTSNSVLMSDPQGNAVFERDINGVFIRSFVATGFGDAAGVTRGPNGDVFATDFADQRVYRWKADGTFVGFS